MELTMHFPWMQRNAALMTSEREESTMNGTRATAGSAPNKLRKWTISLRASSRPSSMLMSTIAAPASTWWRAMLTASS